MSKLVYTAKEIRAIADCAVARISDYLKGVRGNGVKSADDYICMANRVSEYIETLYDMARQKPDRTEEKMNTVIITERGWAGHFILARRCLFRRNTLVQYGEKSIIVSTVGALVTKDVCEIEMIGHERFFETCVFRAEEIGEYVEADVSEELYDYEDAIYAKSLEELRREYPFFDNNADQMHDRVVQDVAHALVRGEL